MELEPGPITREEMPLGPRIATDALFEGLADPLVGALSGSDGGLFSLQSEIASNVADGLDGTFETTVGAAEVANANNAGAGDDQTADALVGTGAGVDAQRTASLPYLPQSDAPIVGDFRDLPDLGTGHPGGGGFSDGDDGNTKEI